MWSPLSSRAGKKPGFLKNFFRFLGFNVLMSDDQTQHLTDKSIEETTSLKLKYD